MMKRRMVRDQRGFSLIEMVITLVILSIVATIGATMMRSGFSAYFVGRDLTPLANQGRVGMERMVREIREGVCSTLPADGSYASLSFAPYLEGGGSGPLVTMAQATGSTVITRLQAGGATKPLLNDVIFGGQAGSLRFTVEKDKCLVTIEFTIRKQLAATGSEEIDVPFVTSTFVRNP